MKKLALLSLVGITSIAFTQAGWAAHHGGGGGGFGGGGFGGIHARGAAGGGTHFSLPAGHFSAIRPGHSFASVGQRPSHQQSVGRPTTALNRGQVSRSAVARRSDQRALNARGHVFARHEGNWHRNWDHRRAHYWNGHWWCWDGGVWIGLDAGYYPWDLFPYYAYDYYPYDYYPGYYAGVQPVYTGSGVPSRVGQNPDPNVVTVQSDLANLGYYHGMIDGRFGPETRVAVSRYQVDHHLGVTGSLTPATLRSLGIQKVATR